MTDTIESSHYQHKIQTLKLNQENQINVLWQFSITFSVALHMTNWTRQLLYGNIAQPKQAQRLVRRLR